MSMEYMEMLETVAEEILPHLGTVVIAYFAAILLAYVYSIAVYILHSLGIYKIAERRGIRHAWLAWLPIGNTWILGSIADQYQYVARGQVKSRRKALLGMYIAVAVLYVACYAALAAGTYMSVEAILDGHFDESALILPLIIAGGSVALVLILALVIMIFEYICYYNMFVSCAPTWGVVFLILSILFPFLMPFLVFGVRNRDRGMPPRRTQTVPQIPADNNIPDSSEE